MNVNLQKDDFFSCDLPKSNIAPGQDHIVKFTFTPPKVDPLLVRLYLKLFYQNNIGWN